MDKRLAQGLQALDDAGFLLEVRGQCDNLSSESRVKSDSRRLEKGDLFACVSGQKFDGHSFVPAAVQQGAAGFLVERPVDASFQIVVSNVRAAMGHMAAALANRPTDRLTMMAVTGTNGKSTSSYMIRSIMEHCGVKTGLVGTVVYHDGERVCPADRTTPESPELQLLLEQMVSHHCGGCVMETSSHGIEQGRINGCLYDGALFTNLTPEHLDYHGTMEAYFKAKTQLFKKYLKPGGVAAVNLGDPWGYRLAQQLPSVVGWCLEREGQGRDVSPENLSSLRLMARNLVLRANGNQFQLFFDGADLGTVHLPMPGWFNVENALGAASLCLASGFAPQEVCSGLEAMPQVPGRMERLVLSNGVVVVIDYAHTAEALECLLGALRPLTKRLVSLFGHGGDRFQGHRLRLGQVASRHADLVWVTMDNPRTEDPASIASQIVEGLDVSTDRRVVINRSDAIGQALEDCGSGDLLVISGKGAEPYLEIRGVKHPYSDRSVVERWASKKGVSWC